MRRKTKKMTNRICIMVDDELKHKLEYIAQVTGKKPSSVARDFIADGEIKAYYGSDKIVRKMCEIEGRMNDYCQHTLDELDAVRAEISRANSMIQARAAGVYRPAPYFICLNAESKVNELERDLRATHKNLDTELTDCVHIPSDSKQEVLDD